MRPNFGKDYKASKTSGQVFKRKLGNKQKSTLSYDEPEVFCVLHLICYKLQCC